MLHLNIAHESRFLEVIPMNVSLVKCLDHTVSISMQHAILCQAAYCIECISRVLIYRYVGEVKRLQVALQD